MTIDNVTIQSHCASSTFRAFTIRQKTHKKRLFEYIYINKFIFCHLPHFVGSTNTRNICLILSIIYSFISASVCIDRGLSALLWPGPILLIRRPWPYVIHHLHFMNMYRLYIAWYRPILLMYVGCINWYFRNKTPFLWLKRPYFHFTDTGVYYPL